ncbi:MAG: rhodanese-like domain-containing protein [Thioalkalispiraceae bacterium]|jgi:rhodanese-related sulfurtransferase
MKNSLIPVGLILPLFLFAVHSQAANESGSGFPGRSKYPDVSIISKQDLKDKYNDVVIVDARSSLEFETLRIKDAINIPVASKTFIEQVKTLRNKTNKTIVFYCNGRTCMKSYKAVKTCNKNDIENTIAYDAGMFEWAKTYPEYASLLGESPIRESDIISKQKFQAHTLHPDAFADEIHKKGSQSLVLDIRDKYQRGAAGFFPGQELWASLDNREQLHRYIKQAKQDNLALFIYDEVGKQVQWLQYALEKENIQNYYFMDKGAKGYFEQMMSEFKIR